MRYDQILSIQFGEEGRYETCIHQKEKKHINIRKKKNSKEAHVTM